MTIIKLQLMGEPTFLYRRCFKRYEAYGWHVQHVEDGNHDVKGITEAIEKAKLVTDKPSIIKISTTIGYGSPINQILLEFMEQLLEKKKLH